MTDPAWLAGFAALREFGLSFDLQVFPGQLRQAAALAADHGDIPLVLDHAGMPIDRDPDVLDRWKRDLAVFAAEPNTTVKISALGTNDHHWTVDSGCAPPSPPSTRSGAAGSTPSTTPTTARSP